MSKGFLLGARGITEHVVTPNEQVDWVLRHPDQPLVIYGDDNSLFLFDLEQHCLHMILAEASYSVVPITQTWRQHARLVVRVRLLTPAQLAVIMRCGTLPLPRAQWERLVEQAAAYPAIQARLRQLERLVTEESVH